MRYGEVKNSRVDLHVSSSDPNEEWSPNLYPKGPVFKLTRLMGTASTYYDYADVKNAFGSLLITCSRIL